MAEWIIPTLFVLVFWILPMVINMIRNKIFTRPLRKSEKSMLIFWGIFAVVVETIILIVTL